MNGVGGTDRLTEREGQMCELSGRDRRVNGVGGANV